MPRTRIPWSKIRKEYLEGDETVTLKILANKYKCHHDTVRRRSSKEKWDEQRVAARSRSSQSQRSQQIAVEAIQFRNNLDRFQDIDQGAIEATEGLIKRINNMISGSDRLRPCDIAHLANSIRTLFDLSQTARGEVGVALGQLADSDILPNDFIPQIAAAFEESDANLQQALSRIFAGQCPD